MQEAEKVETVTDQQMLMQTANKPHQKVLQKDI